ncbi:alpha/beta hydrolase [Catenulispora yoronensis]|uniref:Alpha/beta hydrolase n=1 Tax=Catenulispora yoronensis TaxID=450799 RepID=A0ABP5FCK3_9ACTN
MAASTAKKAGIAGVAVGVIAAGAAAGFALERATIGRAVRRLAEPRRPAEPYGTLRGRPLTVRAEDGVGLYVEVDGPQLFTGGAGWARKGPGTTPGGPTLVFCHGYALHQDTWHYQRAEFAATNRCVFWDQRGHGRSERGTQASHTIDQIGRDLRTVLDAVCPDGDVILIGHSMGGMSILALAAEHPELFGGGAGDHARVCGVVLVSTTDGHWNEMTLGLPAGAARLFQRTAPGVFALLGRGHTLVDRTRRAGTDLAQLLTRRYAFASDVPPALVRFTDEMLSSTPMDVIADFFPTFAAHDKAGALATLGHVPVEIVVGDHDLLTPAFHSERMAAQIDEGAAALPEGAGHRAGLEIVPRGGHVLPLEHPDAVDGAIRRVLARTA